MGSWSWLGSLACVVVAASCASTTHRPRQDAEAGAGGETGGSTSANGGAAEGGDALPGVAGTRAGLGGAGTSGAGEAGAGGEPWLETTEGWLGGTRLRPVLKTFGSVKLFQHWYDMLLGVDCAFALDSHGTERCLPLAPPEVVTGYRDKACKQPVLNYPHALSEVPKYVASPDWVGCGTGRVIHEVGAELPGAEASYDQLRGECEPAMNEREDPIVRELGALVADETFVAATRWVREPRGEGLEANVRIAEDGSREVASHFDVERGVDCVPERSSCKPRDEAFASFGFLFADSDCTIKAALRRDASASPCRAPAIIYDDDSGKYFEPGQALTPPVYTGSCTPFPIENGGLDSFYTLGSEVSADTFPRISHELEGSGRAQVTTLRAVGGAGAVVAQVEPFYDTGFGECAVIADMNGDVRCLPRDAELTFEFADDACTQAVRPFATTDTPVSGTLVRAPTVGDVGTAVFELGAKMPTPDAVWYLNGPDCVPGFVSLDSDYYATIPVAPAEFLPIQRLVE